MLQAFRVGDKAPRQARVGYDFECEPPVVSFVSEWPRHHFYQAVEEHLFGFHGYSAGLNFRQVENIADQVQKIRPGAVDSARELDLPAAEVSVRILRQLLAKNQDTVERST